MIGRVSFAIVIAWSGTAAAERPDLEIRAGESVTVHEPNGMASIRVDASKPCASIATLVVHGAFSGRVDSDVLAIYAAPRTSATYEVHCSDRTKAVAKGSIVVVQDDGTKPLGARVTDARVLSLAAPATDATFATTVTVIGHVVAGASVMIGVDAPKPDNQHRFSLDHRTPAGAPIVIRVTHPRYGLHVYVRRSSPAQHEPTYEDRRGCKDCPTHAEDHPLAFTTACNAKDLSAARAQWWQLGDDAKTTLVDACIRNKITREQLDAPSYLELATTPPASVIVDDRDSGLTTPITGTGLPLAPGQHKITFVVGDLRYARSVTIGAGVVEKLHWELP